MSKCAVKRGIVALRDCGNDATDTCTVCSRPICREHTRIRGTQVMCVECYARQEQQDAAAAGSRAGAGAPKAAAKGAKGTDYDENAWQDDSWPYYYRHAWYTTSFYHPFYNGIYYDTYYDDYDLRAFADSTQRDLDDDSTAGGFYDS
ncbi:MAG: hypothetical protein JST22_07280 [Bacteroidetes bacterium]|nr:hypothetical protein [Bacteroidota bacterium]